jgi:hypothetical protein
MEAELLSEPRQEKVASSALATGVAGAITSVAGAKNRRPPAPVAPRR